METIGGHDTKLLRLLVRADALDATLDGLREDLEFLSGCGLVTQEPPIRDALARMAMRIKNRYCRQPGGPEEPPGGLSVARAPLDLDRLDTKILERLAKREDRNDRH